MGVIWYGVNQVGQTNLVKLMLYTLTSGGFFMENQTEIGGESKIMAFSNMAREP